MIDNRNDFLTGLKTLIGDNTSDEVLDLLEYANSLGTDSETQIAQLNERITTLETEKETLQTEKDNLDKEWRTRYRDTFYSPKPAGNDPNIPKTEPKPVKHFSDLFIEKKE